MRSMTGPFDWLVGQFTPYRWRGRYRAGHTALRLVQFKLLELEVGQAFLSRRRSWFPFPLPMLDTSMGVGFVAFGEELK